MNEEQYEAVRSLAYKNPNVSIAELEYQHDRTLLYGYDVDRNTWHTYIQDGVIHHHIYNSNKDTLAHYPLVGSIRLSLIVPNKRLYPERCDFEFSRLIAPRLEYGLPFTTYDINRQVKRPDGYYGLVA